MLFGTLVTVVGFVPIGFAQSGVGEYAGNIFWVLAFALLVSWLVAVIFTPYLGVKLLPELKPAQAHDHGDMYQTPLYRRLRADRQLCVARRKTVVAATVALLVLAIAGMAGPVQKQFFPSSDRPEVLVSVYLPQGSSIGATDRTMRKIEAILAPHAGGQDAVGLRRRRRAALLHFRQPRAARPGLRQGHRRDARMPPSATG